MKKITCYTRNSTGYIEQYFYKISSIEIYNCRIHGRSCSFDWVSVPLEFSSEFLMPPSFLACVCSLIYIGHSLEEFKCVWSGKNKSSSAIHNPESPNYDNIVLAAIHL